MSLCGSGQKDTASYKETSKKGTTFSMIQSFVGTKLEHFFWDDLAYVNIVRGYEAIKEQVHIIRAIQK